MPKLSVIIPIYNVEKYLAKCIESVITKSEVPYEIVLVNDGSTDGSAAIAESYRARYPALISVIATENMGLGSARNTGMDHSTGEYLYFLDSDDYLAPGGIDSILACLEEDFDLCIFDSITVSEDGRELRHVSGCRPGDVITLDEYPELLLEIPNVWNKIYRRSLFTDNAIRFPGRAWFEDIRTIPKFYVLADKIVYKPEAWHRYLLRGGSITNSANAARNREIIDAMDDLVAFYRQQECYDRLKDILEYLVFHQRRAGQSGRRPFPGAGGAAAGLSAKVSGLSEEPLHSKDQRKAQASELFAAAPHAWLRPSFDDTQQQAKIRKTPLIGSFLFQSVLGV